MGRVFVFVILTAGCHGTTTFGDGGSKDLGISRDMAAPSRCTELGSWTATGMKGVFNGDSSLADNWLLVGLGSSSTEPLLGLESFGPSAQINGTFDLSAPAERDYATCTHCALAWLDCTTSSCAKGPYFQVSGTATYQSTAAAPGQSFSGIYSDVELDLATISDVAPYHSTLVPGGDCVHLTQIVFGATAELAASDMATSSPANSSLSESAGNATAGP